METPAQSCKTSAVHHASGRFAEAYRALAFLAAALLVYSPALRGGFLWDDETYISGNATLHSLRGLREIWLNPDANTQYYPLSFTGFWAGYHLWGLNTTGYHLANVFFHALAAVLLWQVFKHLKLRGALLAGALFALHPVNVMSVAWMTEFKNTLSASLALGAAWAYLRFEGLGVYAGAGGARRPWRWYAVVIVLFQLAMFAKTAVSFLPVSLLLIAWWQRGRIGWREIAPLLPLVGIVAAMGSFTLFIERTSGGAHGAAFALSFPEKILISGRSFWFYLGKLFFPARLVFFYPRWQLDTGDWRQWLYPAATVVFLTGLWLLRRKIDRGPFAAAMHFYVSTSMLVLMVVLYMMKFTFVSDHWQYFGAMGVMPVIASAIVRLLDWRGLWGKPVGNAVVAGLLAVLSILSWRQCAMYSDIDTLYTKTLSQNRGCWIAWNNLGVILYRRGSTDEAIFHYRKALEIKPDYAEAHYNLGLALAHEGETDQAIAQYQKALEIEPDYAEIHYDLGLAYQKKGQTSQAVEQYQEALKLMPDMRDAHLNLGNLFGQKGELREAMEQYQKVLDIDPGYALAHYDIGFALQLNGQAGEAIAHYEKALEIKPDFTAALNSLAYVLATCPQASLRNGAKALELAQQADQTTRGGNPEVIQTLAAAYAECGRFSEAAQTAQLALNQANSQSNAALADQLRSQIALYKANKPYRDERLGK